MSGHRQPGAPPGPGSPVDLERYGAAALGTRLGTKWSREHGRMLGAWIADMDFPLAPPVKDALIATIARDDLGYPDPELEREVVALFVDRMQACFDLRVDPGLVRLTTDVVQALSLVLTTLTGEGDGVVFFTPAYPPYFPLLSSAKRRAVPVDLVDGPRGFEIDFGALEAALAAEHPRLLLLCNPHNPTGRVFDEAELARLGELALRHDLIVVSDEIHEDLVFEPHRHRAIAACSPEVARRTVTTTSASKAFNLAGMRCALTAFGAPELVRPFDALAYRSRGEVSILGLVATRAAYLGGEPWLAAVRAYLAANRAVVGERLASLPGLGYIPPEATYLAWVDCRGLSLGEEPASFLARTAAVAVSPGTDFGPGGEGRFRLNFATPRPVLEEILARVLAHLAAGRGS